MPGLGAVGRGRESREVLRRKIFDGLKCVVIDADDTATVRGRPQAHAIVGRPEDPSRGIGVTRGGDGNRKTDRGGGSPTSGAVEEHEGRETYEKPDEGRRLFEREQGEHQDPGQAPRDVQRIAPQRALAEAIEQLADPSGQNGERRSDQEEQADDDANGLGRLQQRGKGLTRVVAEPSAEQEVLARIDEDHVGDAQATGAGGRGTGRAIQPSGTAPPGGAAIGWGETVSGVLQLSA